MPKPEPKKTTPAAPPRPGSQRTLAPGRSEPLAVKSGVPRGATESGWLPDFVYTGEKFEAGLAFFADSVGRISRFSREPADLANARRLEGQAALPGLVNAHSHSFQRVFRGRLERSSEANTALGQHALQRISDEDIFDAARIAFMEMLLSGVTCVGEFHVLRHRPDGTRWADANHLAREVVRAAHDVGIRIALLNAGWLHGDFRGDAMVAPVRFRNASVDEFIRESDALRVAIERELPADEAWLGVGAWSLAAVPIDAFKTIADYAHAQRLRFHTHVSSTAAENAACAAQFGRTPITLLAEHGVIDKRFTAIDATHLSDDEMKLLGSARASVCVCPDTALSLGHGVLPPENLVAAGAGLALGSDANQQIDLLKTLRVYEQHLRGIRGQRNSFGPDSVRALFHAATVSGARSLGATGGALEVGRPADFFTVGLYDPSIAGADAESLLANVLFSLERRAIRDVWVGARQRITNGRHLAHGAVVGRFVDTQRRLWSG